MIDRRNFPRLDAHAFWRPVGPIARQRPVVDMSLGGMRIYGDERVRVDDQFEVELLFDGEGTIEVLARVVRVDALRGKKPAAFDIALEFVDVPKEARKRLSDRLRAAARNSQMREDEDQREHVEGVEDDDGEEHLLEAAARAPITRSPNGKREMREKDGDEDDLLHRAKTGSEASRTCSRKTKRSARRRLSILFVTPYLPSPPRFGGQMRLHGLISGTASHHDVSVLSLVDGHAERDEEAVRATEAYCQHVSTVPERRLSAGRAAKRLLQLGSLLSPRSYEWLAHHGAEFGAALGQALERTHYDIVSFEFTHMAAYGTNGARRNGTAFVLDEHNIEYDLVRQTTGPGSALLRRAYSALDWRKIRKEEIRTWTRLDGCTLTSERDEKILLADAPHARTAVVPNGVDIERFRPSDPPLPETPGTLLFFGAIDYHPNTDGLLFFLNDVWPLLRSSSPATTPELKVSIVGRRPPSEILAHAARDVEVVGAVDDVRPYIERAAVVIVPLRLGSGTRLKILEAMAMGKAVVTTTLGAQGLDVVPGRDLLIADDAEMFATQIRKLLGNRAFASQLGASARKLVTERYTWGASVDRLVNFYREILEARASS
ncbi:MAG: glycosyltransferase [Polyangiaceae bacterium]